MDFISLFTKQYPAEFSALLLGFYVVVDQVQKWYINRDLERNKKDAKEGQDILFKKLDEILKEINQISCNMAGLKGSIGQKD